MAKSFSLGRDATNDIVLDNRTVSRRHGRLDLAADGSTFIHDLGSSNGSFFVQEGDLVPLDGIELNENDLVLLGGLEIGVGDLISFVQKSQLNARVDNAPSSGGPLHVKVTGKPNGVPRLGGRVRRDPKTGKIIRDV